MGTAPPPLRASAVLTAVCGGLAFGYDACVFGYAQQGMAAALGLTTLGVEAVSAALFAGAAVGALVAGAAADAVGQLAVLRGTAALFVGAALAMAAAPGFGAMLAGRAVAGLAVGASVMVVPVYLSERSPPAARAGVVALLDVAVCVGCVVAAVAGAVAAADILRGAATRTWPRGGQVRRRHPGLQAPCSRLQRRSLTNTS